MSWFDVGINLTDRRFEKRIDDLLSHSANADVSHLLAIGTSLEDSLDTLDLIREKTSRTITIKSTAGFHPHNAKLMKDGDSESLAALLNQPEVVAIGECGLDFNRNFSPPDVQLRVFETQLELASDLKLPIYLHERDAFEHQIQLLRKYSSAAANGLVHCFTGNVEQLNHYLELGLSVGITGWVCDPERGKELREALKELPLDKLLLETDAPYLAPKDIRPRPKYNQPSLLPHIAQTVADIKHISVGELKEQSFANACRLFSIDVGSR
ncbi:hydrolase TatD [Alteromonadaceae bacterium M269]|nr:hydrolase TatD [Alteromonadaceae bacterium M269]